MCLAKFKKKKYVEPSEERFDAMMVLVKDLDKATYNRFKQAMDLGWDSYQKIRNVKTIDEKEEEKVIKENADIDAMERVLDKESKK